MKKFQSLGKVLSKDEQFRIKGGCTPEEMCDPNDILSCGGLVVCSCSQVQGSFNCCRNAQEACARLRCGAQSSYSCSG